MHIKYAIIPLILALVVGFSAAPAYARQSNDDDNDQQEQEMEDEDEDDDEDDEEDTDEDEDEDTEEDQKEFTELSRKSGPKVLVHNGKVELNAATVTEVGSSTATVSVFGLSFMVDTDDAEFKDGTALEKGATAWIKGMINSTTGKVSATEVRTFTGTGSDANASRIEALKKQVEELMERLKKLLGN